MITRKTRSLDLVACSILLVCGTGCRSDQKREEAPGAQALASALAAAGNQTATEALAAAASAQALGAAVAVQAQSTVSGSVHSVGGKLGTFDVALTDCHSGEVNGFFGVDLFAAGSDELRLRYVHDEAKGEIVKVAYPSGNGKVNVFNGDDKCTVLEGSVQKSNVSTWSPKGKIRHVSGRVKFDCTHRDEPGHVSGEVTFSDCH